MNKNLIIALLAESASFREYAANTLAPLFSSHDKDQPEVKRAMNLFERARNLVRDNKKIEAIKIVRNYASDCPMDTSAIRHVFGRMPSLDPQTTIGLAEAKWMVESNF
jgi:hypothetical protein